MNKALVHNIDVGRFLDWQALDAEGIAGGILLLWDKRRLSSWSQSMEASQFLTCSKWWSMIFSGCSLGCTVL